MQDDHWEKIESEWVKIQQDQLRRRKNFMKRDLHGVEFFDPSSRYRFFFFEFVKNGAHNWNLHAQTSLISKISRCLDIQGRNVRYTDIPKISVLKPISVYRYEFFSHTDIPKFPIYRNFSVYRIKFTHHAYGEIINFCFTQMQSKRSRHFVLKTMSTASKLS